MHPDFAFRREFGRIVALCPNHDVCGFEGKVQEAVVRKCIPLSVGITQVLSVLQRAAAHAVLFIKSTLYYVPMQDHIPVCPGVKELCSHGCGELLSLDKKDSHDTTCSFRKSKCDFCEEEVMEVERIVSRSLCWSMSLVYILKLTFAYMASVSMSDSDSMVLLESCMYR